MDVPDQPDAYAPIFIAGIESEEVEELNDAYKDILEEMGEQAGLVGGKWLSRRGFELQRLLTRDMSCPAFL